MQDLLTDARSEPGIKLDWTQVLQGIGKHDTLRITIYQSNIERLRKGKNRCLSGSTEVAFSFMDGESKN